MEFCNPNKGNSISLAAAFCLALAGCGGDDSGSAATSGTGDTMAGVVITEANMVDVAGGVIMATSANSLGTTNASLVMGVETSSTPAPTDRLTKLAVDQAKAASSALAAQNVVVGVQSSETLGCSVSGTKTYSYDIQSTSGSFAAGDSVSVTFNSCQEADGTLLNGGMQLAINSFSGFTDPNVATGSMNISVAFTNLSVTNSQVALNANGGMTIAATFNDPYVSFSIQASSLSYGLEAGGKSASMTLSNLMLSAEEDSQKVQFSISETFSARFPTFSGSGDVSTLSPLVDYWWDGIDEGKFKVIGANCVLYVTFQGSDQVLLELDKDNDGIIDAFANKTLFELDPTIGLI